VESVWKEGQLDLRFLSRGFALLLVREVRRGDCRSLCSSKKKNCTGGFEPTQVRELACLGLAQPYNGIERYFGFVTACNILFSANTDFASKQGKYKCILEYFNQKDPSSQRCTRYCIARAWSDVTELPANIQINSRHHSYPQSPYHLENMDITKSSCVLLLNLPPSALGGIDLLSFTTAPRFRGIKNLPPGWHFVFTSSTSDLSVRHGSWFFVKGATSGIPEVFIKKWDPKNEELVDETDAAERLRWRANLGSIWKEGLSPYRQSATQDTEGSAQEEKQDWKLLTAHITESLLSRIVGNKPNHWTLTSASSAPQDLEHIPGLSSNSGEIQPEKELDFLPIDLKRTWRPGATGRERTDAALDHTWALSDLIEQHCHNDAMELLGEMQFCFLMVLSLNNYSCLEQWKRILSLLFTCRDAVTKRPELFVNAISTLRLQLQRSQDAEGGLFDLKDEGGSLLKSLLHKFKLGLKELSGIEKIDVMDEMDELERYLSVDHGWRLDSDFLRKGMIELEDGERVELEVTGYEEEDESGEYAPTVVDLTPEQIATLTGGEVVKDEAQKGETSKKEVVRKDKDERKEKHDQKDEGQHEYEEDDQELDDMDTRY
jgi:A1 cistron-splicing factor AAR2